MTLDNWLSVIENSPIGSAVRGDTGWPLLFPTIETLHVLSLTAVFGSIVMVDLRLMGVSSRNAAVSRLTAEVVPYTWTAYVMAAITGILLFTSRAQTYVHNIQFQMKFLLMLLAAINMAVFHLGAYRHVMEWDYTLPPPRSARVAGALSMALWLGVIFFGRWIGFATGGA